jgi:hypothetical protein
MRVAWGHDGGSVWAIYFGGHGLFGAWMVG